MAQTPTTSLKLDPEMKVRVKKLAEARRRSAHWVMREAIEQYVAREESRETFKQEALASWAEYQATRLHVTGDEMDAWFDRVLGGEHDTEPPEPHA
jgi:predicted transcriptional regulator